MATSSLPLDIKELLTDYIDSVAQLEALMLFLRDPQHSWTPETLSKELRSSHTSAAKQMAQLANSGFIRTNEKNEYYFAPANEKLRTGAEKLNDVFKEKQVAVIAFLYERPTDKLKGFADAFKLRKD